MLSKIKSIFSKNILANSLDFIKPYTSNEHLEYIHKSVNKFLACRDISKGYISFRCSHCNFQHKMKLTCKSRLCNSCGFAYSSKWTNSTTNDLINIPHRHVLFTVPKEFRKFICYDRTILSKMASSINQIFKYQFNNTKDKNKSKNFIAKSNPNYFTSSDIIYYGLITVIHTFGRDLKFNPHIHALVSLGGLNKDFKYKKLKYFHVNSIANQWKFILCDLIKNGNYPNNMIKFQALKTVSLMYNNNVRFFFYVGDNDVNNPKGIIKYLGRYLARVPIAEYKITNVDFENSKVTFKTLTFDKFVTQLLIHLPHKNFKMINRFGFYARRISCKIKLALISLKKRFKSNFSIFRSNFKKLWKFDPFFCMNCNIKLDPFELFIFDSIKGLKIHKFYNPNGLLFTNIKN